MNENKLKKAIKAFHDMFDDVVQIEKFCEETGIKGNREDSKNCLVTNLLKSFGKVEFYQYGSLFVGKIPFEAKNFPLFCELETNFDNGMYPHLELTNS